MAESVVSFVVERLGNLLIEEAAFLEGVYQQVKQIQIELKRMQCFLKDADKKQNDDESVQNWVSEIREAAYDVQDVIETFALEIASKNRENNPVKRYVPSFNNSRKLHKVGSRIESIKTRISDLTRSLQTYGVTPMKEEGSSLALDRQRQLRWSYSHIVEEYIVGLDENIKEVVGQLVNEDKQCQVVSICGMGGLGKTTLAKKVYHHSYVRRHFDGFAWAYISQQCKTRDVWEGILIKLTSPAKDERDQISKMRDEELAKKLNQVQKEKRCLVILDDIWSTEAWDLLSPGFPSGQVISSKILLTTRNREVALHIDPSGFLHEPGCLNEEQSWELFQKKAFQRQDPAGTEATPCKSTYSSHTPTRKNLNVPLTQPRRCSWEFSNGQQRREIWGENIVCTATRKLPIEPSITTENVQAQEIQDVNGDLIASPSLLNGYWKRSCRDMARLKDDSVIKFASQPWIVTVTV